MRHHFLDSSESVNRWDNSEYNRLVIDSGDLVTLKMKDASDGQVKPGMKPKEFAKIDTTRIHSLTGPVGVFGAEPGDRLKIELLEFEHEGWAWTSIIPGLGLLSDEFESHFIFHWMLEGDTTRSMPGATVDLDPFCGVIGVQRNEVGSFRTRPPGLWGGNMDVKHLTRGAVLHLPVLTPGAGLCAGDCHAAQGDGEVSINGMEAPMTVTMRVDLIKNGGSDPPYAIVPGALNPCRYSLGRWHTFIESDPDPVEASRRVVRRAIEFIMNRLKCSKEQAYVLCSVVLDLKLSQMVNVPQITVSGYLPEAIFD
jgi:acetamidase/formamidase